MTLHDQQDGQEELTKEELSRFARYLASRRRVVARTCAVCDKPIQGTAKRRYCDNTCAARAYRQRRRDERTPTAR